MVAQTLVCGPLGIESQTEVCATLKSRDSIIRLST